MAECKNCFHQKVCKYKTEKISAGTTVQETIHKCVDYTPTADVADVVYAKWEISSDGYYPYCSHCKTEPENGVMSKYCPNCGAKMRRSDDKNE